MVESVTASLVLGIIAVVLAAMTIVRAVRRRSDAASHAARERDEREASRRRRAA